MAKKPEKGGDELDVLKASLLKKDLDVITITDKMRRLEDRSTYIVGSMEKLNVGAREKILTLTEIIDFLTKYSHKSLFLSICWIVKVSYVSLDCFVQRREYQRQQNR